MVTRWSLELPWPTDVLILPLITATFCVDLMCVPLKSPTRLSKFFQCVKRTEQNIIRAKLKNCFFCLDKTLLEKNDHKTKRTTQIFVPEVVNPVEYFFQF